MKLFVIALREKIIIMSLDFTVRKSSLLGVRKHLLWYWPFPSVIRGNDSLLRT